MLVVRFARFRFLLCVLVVFLQSLEVEVEVKGWVNGARGCVRVGALRDRACDTEPPTRLIPGSAA